MEQVSRIDGLSSDSSMETVSSAHGLVCLAIGITLMTVSLPFKLDSAVVARVWVVKVHAHPIPLVWHNWQAASRPWLLPTSCMHLLPSYLPSF